MNQAECAQAVVDRDLCVGVEALLDRQTMDVRGG